MQQVVEGIPITDYNRVLHLLSQFEEISPVSGRGDLQPTRDRLCVPERIAAYELIARLVVVVIDARRAHDIRMVRQGHAMRLDLVQMDFRTGTVGTTRAALVYVD